MNVDVLARTEAPVPVTLPTILIDTTQPTTPVASDLYGLFFDDINDAGEGGLYAELIANRFFEEGLAPTARAGEKLPGWQTVAPEGARVTLELDRGERMNASRLASLRVTVAPGPTGRAGLANQGRGGIALRAGAAYRVRLCMRAMADFQGDLRVTLETPDGRSLAETTLTCHSTCWSDVSCELVSSADEPQARLSITTARGGGFWLGMVSLFPAETWRKRPNGLRPDLAEMLLALRPRFLRFPVGFGSGADATPRWKRTVGDITKRSAHRNLRGGYSTGGLGYDEFLQLAEDLGAAPLLVTSCDRPAWSAAGEPLPLELLDEWIQDTLDAIEYANGPAEEGWSMLRAQHGHPEPFGLRYIEIDAQGCGPQYDACYKSFYRAIKARYPALVVIAGAPVASAPVELIDERFHAGPDFFVAHHDHYDEYNRSGPPVYVGEYSAAAESARGNLGAAVAEAAFLIGLERNPAVVRLACYAPLLCHVGHPQPQLPDAIYFDNQRAYGTPSYHVTRMFSAHRGDELVQTGVQTPRRQDVRSGAVGLGALGGPIELRELSIGQAGGPLELSIGQAGGPAQHTDPELWEQRHGAWQAGEGAWRSPDNPAAYALLPGNSQDVSVTLRVRALAEGGGLRLRFRDNRLEQERQDYCCLELGGGTFRFARQAGQARELIGQAVLGELEPGRWYTVHLEAAGEHLSAWVDDQCVLEASMRPLPDLVAVATREHASGDLLLKVVNSSAAPRSTSVELRGCRAAPAEASVLTLTSDSPEDENSFAEPERVVPAASTLELHGDSFRYTFRPHSVNLIRLQVTA
jgi:alpha-L-arabinofuranosidase